MTKHTKSKDLISAFWILKRARMCVHAHVTRECMNQSSDMQSYAEILYISVKCLQVVLYYLRTSVRTPASSICFPYKWFGSRFFDLIVSLRLANAFKQIHWFVYFSSLSFLEYSAVQNSNALLAGLLHFFVIFDFSRAAELKI